jgi:hypothetical protein
MVNRTWYCAAFFLTLVFLPSVLADDAVLDIGSRRELFVDPFLIDSLDGVDRRLHHPQPGESVLTFDKPWEGRYSGYVTVFRDGDRLRMYYRGLPLAGADGSSNEVTCYAESVDGVTWTKPDLGLYEVSGTSANNVVLADMAPFSHNFAPFLDLRPGVRDDERYKALAGTSKTGLVAFASADGLQWRKLTNDAVITEGAFDSQNVAFWSESESQYLCYFRVFHNGVRSITRTTSQDFRTWSTPELMGYGDTTPEHLYTNQTQPYYRAPHIYIATAARFMPGRRVVSVTEAESLGGEAAYSGDCSDVVLLSSRGGARYDRSFMGAFIRPGLGLEHWTSRTNYPACGVVETGDGALSIYVQRRYGQLNHHLQRFVLRPDGFVSMHGSYQGGSFVTKPVRFSGASLQLNGSTSAAGGIRVELQDADGNALDGFEANTCDEWIGDWIDRRVTWANRSDVSALAGQSVRLRFVLRDADLFAIKFE